MFKNFAKPGESIIEHTLSCYEIAKQLVKIFKNELDTLNIEAIQGEDILILSILFHDLGKYAQPFQNKTLNQDYKGNWGYRHEIFSAEFINLIIDLPLKTKEMIQLAILSHHNKTIKELEQATFSENNNSQFIIPGISLEIMNNNRKEIYEEAKNSIIQYFDEISSEIKTITKKTNFNKQFKFNYSRNKLINIFDLIEKYYNSVCNYQNDFDFDKITFLKGLLVTADHLGSGHQKINFIDIDIQNFYKAKFQIPELGSFTSIQKNCVQSKGENAILKAPTGTGKTEAAFLWINENLKNNLNSRIFYVLPYTASINAMFERINSLEFSKNKVDLLHGKNTTYYFELFTKNHSEEEISENIKEITNKVKLQKLTAKSYSNPIKIVTPHQIIKNFYGLKHFEEAFIQYTKGLFIFDEIHCYDKEFLAEIIVIMKEIKEKFNGKFLFMSATFPITVTKLIKKYIEIDLPTIEFNQDEISKYTKVKLNLIDGMIQEKFNLKIIQTDIDKGKRVLIICNTINKAQEIFEKINCSQKIMLHSAFNMNDRKLIEQKVLKSEKLEYNKKLQVLIGTQAIEVSLDLDYDCCYSEIASIDALIQRFGRVYRNRKRGDNDYGIVNVFLDADDGTKLIYNEKTFDFISETRKELKGLNDKPLDYISICNAVDNVFSESYGDEIEKFINKKIEINKNSKLIPMKDYSNEARMYFEQFDGIKVLPECLINEYIKKVKEKRYIEADNLFVTLSERKLYSFYRQNFISKFTVLGENIFISNESILKYDREIGLYLAKDENDKFKFDTNFW